MWTAYLWAVPPTLVASRPMSRRSPGNRRRASMWLWPGGLEPVLPARRTRRLVELLLTITVLSVIPSPKGMTQTDRMQTIVKRLAARKNHVGPARCRIEIVTRNTPAYRKRIGRPDMGPFVTTQMEWAADGARRALRWDEQVPERLSGGLRPTPVLELFDGRYRYVYTGSKPAGLVIMPTRLDKTSRLCPLTFGYMLDRAWYVDVLSAGSFKLQGTVRDPVYGPLAIVSGTTPEGTQCRFWLAVRRDYVAVRSEALYPGGHDRILTVSKGLVRVGHMWLASQGEYTWESLSEGRLVPFTTTSFRASALSATGVAADLFRLPKLQPGTNIHDQRRGQWYRVGKSGQWIPDGAIARKGSAPRGQNPWGFMFIGCTVIAFYIALTAAMRRLKGRWARHGST